MNLLKMYLNNVRCISFVLLMGGFLTSCATVKYSESITDYQNDINKLNGRLAIDSTDTEALRELGIIYFQTRQYNLAKTNLDRAYLLEKNDPKLLFYFGLTLEFQRREAEAVQIYKRYTDFSRLSPYRNKMAGRYRWFSREFARKEAHQLLQDSLDVSGVPPKSVAVFPMIYRGGEGKYSPLGRGLSEMIMIDLGHVPGITLIERIRIQALLDELKFAENQYVDPETSPQYGQLLGASKIVGGVYDVFSDHRMFVDMSYWDLTHNTQPFIAGKMDHVDQLFRLEKDLVFEIIHQLGIELTPEEKEKIQFIPTKNLQAFMAFCMGLQKEDAYLYDEAAAFYQQAANIDPSFSVATDGAVRAQSISDGGGAIEDVAASLNTKLPSKPQNNTMLNKRMQALSSSMGSNFIPGEESRKPMEEVINTAGALDVLPEPPPPPDKH